MSIERFFKRTDRASKPTMMSRRTAATGAAAAVAAPLLMAGPAQAQTQHKWKAQNLYGPTTVLFKDFERFAERVKETTKGTVLIETLPVATIVPQAEALDAVKAGLLDAAAGTMAYQGGKEPAAAFWDLAGGYDDTMHLLMWHKLGGGAELMNKIAARWDAVFVGPVIVGLESIPSKRPIRSIADFKGLKIRSPDGIPAALFTKLGASVSVLPGTEVYTALDTGKVEATDWSTLSVNDEAGYNRIAPYAVYPGIHSLNSIDFVVRRARWNALSADQKAAVQTALEEWNMRTMMNQELEDRKAVAKRDPSTLIAWGDKEKLELRKVAQSVWEEWSKRSPLAKEVYDSHVQFLKMMGKL
jgi:TRAP-type mannitol/chloroaromatic compound transport system substrate-binding protein